MTRAVNAVPEPALERSTRLQSIQHPALQAAGRRAIAGLRDFADQLDAAGLRPMGTSALHEASEVSAMLAAALRRLDLANDDTRAGEIRVTTAALRSPACSRGICWPRGEFCSSACNFFRVDGMLKGVSPLEQRLRGDVHCAYAAVVAASTTAVLRTPREERTRSALGAEHLAVVPCNYNGGVP